MTMEIEDIVLIALFIFDAVICSTLIINTFLMLRKGKRHIIAAFFIFAMLSTVLSDLYWISFTFIRPSETMPIAANEIAEGATFLLLAMILKKMFSRNRISARWEMFFAAMFMAASVVLWIIWTQEWVQDIFGGLALGYFLCACVSALKKAEVLKRYEWYLLAVCSGVIIAALFVVECVPEPAATSVEIFSYILMLIVLLTAFVKNIIAIRAGADAKRRMTLACSYCVWSVITMFLSEHWVYDIACVFCSVSLIFIFLSVKKEGGG